MTCRPKSHRRPKTARSRRAARLGYTMIELMVVISIIAILVGLITFASVGFVGQAKVAATQATIKKVDEAIQERIGAVNRWHMQPSNRVRRDWSFKGWETRWDSAGVHPATFSTPVPSQVYDDILMVLSRNETLRELLPVNQSELNNCYWFNARFATVAEKNAALTPLDLPAEVFFYALISAPVFGGERVAEENFATDELGDSDGDGNLELIDAWGQPLRFYRCPTRLVNDGRGPGVTWDDIVARKTLLPNAPQSNVDPKLERQLKTDPDDPAGYFSRDPLLSLYQSYFLRHGNTWYAPLVVSSGPDLILGLGEPNQTQLSTSDSTPIQGRLAEVLRSNSDPNVRTTAIEAIYDNITNHNSDGGL